MDNQNQNPEAQQPSHNVGEAFQPTPTPDQNATTSPPQQNIETIQQPVQAQIPPIGGEATPGVVYGDMLPTATISKAPKKSHLKLILIIMAALSVFFLFFFFLVLPKLITKNAVNHAFDTQKQQQQQAGPVQYKLAAQPVKFGTATPASLTLPDSWKVDLRTGASSVAAYGPIDYVNGMTQPSIDASESSSYSGQVSSDISSYKNLHATYQLLSEKTSTVAGLPATTLEYKVANTLGQKAGTATQHYDHNFAVFIDNNTYAYHIHATYDERQKDVLGPLFNQVLQSFTYK